MEHGRAKSGTSAYSYQLPIFLLPNDTWNNLCHDLGSERKQWRQKVGRFWLILTHVRKPRVAIAAYLHLKILKTIFSNNKTLRCQAVNSVLCSLKYVSTLSSHPSLGFLPQKIHCLPTWVYVSHAFLKEWIFLRAKQEEKKKVFVIVFVPEKIICFFIPFRWRAFPKLMTVAGGYWKPLLQCIFIH